MSRACPFGGPMSVAAPVAVLISKACEAFAVPWLTPISRPVLSNVRPPSKMKPMPSGPMAVAAPLTTLIVYSCAVSVRLMP